MTTSPGRFRGYAEFSEYQSSVMARLAEQLAHPPTVPPQMTEEERLTHLVPYLKAARQALEVLTGDRSRHLSYEKQGFTFHRDGRFTKVRIGGVGVASMASNFTCQQLLQVVVERIQSDGRRVAEQMAKVLNQELRLPAGHKLTWDIEKDLRWIADNGSHQFSFHIVADKTFQSLEEARAWQAGATWIEAEFRCSFTEPDATVWLDKTQLNISPRVKTDTLFNKEPLIDEGDKFVYCADYKSLAESLAKIHNAAVANYLGFEQGFAPPSAPPEGKIALTCVVVEAGDERAEFDSIREANQKVADFRRRRVCNKIDVALRFADGHEGTTTLDLFDGKTIEQTLQATLVSVRERIERGFEGDLPGMEAGYVNLEADLSDFLARYALTDAAAGPRRPATQNLSM